MGMYDNIKGHIRCTICDGINLVEEQIKYTDCILETFIVGDFISARDGEYFSTPYRDNIIKCEFCENEIKYKVVVKDGIFKEIKSVDFFDEQVKSELKNEYEEKNKKQMREFWDSINKIKEENKKDGEV